MRLRRFVMVLVVPLTLARAGLGGDGAAELRARLADIEKRQKGVFDRFVAELEKVERTESAQQPVVDRFHEALRKNIDEAFNLARANPDDPVAFESLKYVVKTNRAGPGDGTAKALRLILERGDVKTAGQGPYLASVALALFQYPDAETLLRRVIAENPNRDDRGDGCYWLSKYLRQQARMVRRFRLKPSDVKDYEKYTAAEPIAKLVREKIPHDLEKEAEALLERIIAEFDGVKMNDDPRTLGEIARGELFALRNLGVGKTAPDIVGADHERKTFKLSDFRGKVVVLAFSGNWCGPCRAMYPQERALVAKLRDKPFVMASVNTDNAVSTLEKSISSGEITWHCWWDGGTDGPITTRWGVSGFPAIFVLDRNGVIRFKDVRGDELDRAVTTLLAEGETN
jgi:thiol-disulfide isomerase/thioredoxin